MTIVCLILGVLVLGVLELWEGPRSGEVTLAESDPQPTADESTMDAAERTPMRTLRQPPSS